MIYVCKCEHTICPNSNNCKRIEAVGEVMDFKHFCNSSNSFEWIIKINKDLETCKLTETQK